MSPAETSASLSAVPRLGCRGPLTIRAAPYRTCSRYCPGSFAVSSYPKCCQASLHTPGKTCWSHYQRDHHLLAVGPSIAAVAVAGFRIQFRFTLHIRARQVIQQQIEIGLEQIFPALLEMHE